MALKVLWAFYVLLATVCLLPLSNAQCSLDLGGPLRGIGGVPFSSLFAEYSSANFIQNGLTYLCYTRSETNNETFSQIRVSVLYQYQLSNGTLQLTLNCLEPSWIYDRLQPSLVQLSAADHVTTNMTREGCVDCRDNSTASFGDPTYCRLPGAPTVPGAPTASTLTPGAIVGIVIGSFALLAIILAIITIVVIVLVVDRKKRYTRA